VSQRPSPVDGAAVAGAGHGNRPDRRPLHAHDPSADGKTADLASRLARFGRALRERGVSISLADTADGLAALSLLGAADREQERLALRAALKIRPRDTAVFEELFARLWDGAEVEAPRSPPPPRLAGPARQRAGASLSGWPAGRQDETAAGPGGEDPGYSPDAMLRRKSFDECSPADLAAMERLLARMALSLATRPSRRRVPVRGRGEPDLRRSFRRAVPHGGEFLSLARRARPIERPRLVVLCDTSGSMDPHARFLLAFVLALGRAVRWGRASEVFAFNTALVRLTPWLSAGRVDLVLERLSRAVPDWSGGTKIGESLAEFTASYLDEMVDGRTTVLILSDGLDRGDIAPLAAAMRAIRSRARRVLWLNPLAGDRRYEPTARAMAAALPYVDRLLPAHNLESLERLLPLLAS
jgi:uncharacterized protein